VFTNHVLRQNLNYQFTRAFSLRAIVDYNTVLPNTTVTAVDPFKRFVGDLLLAWVPYPGTAVYLGYTNRRENLALIGTDFPALVRTAGPSLQAGSQGFAKVSYLFRF